MPQKKHGPEEIAAKRRQVDVPVSPRRSVAEAVRPIGVTRFTYDRWRRERAMSAIGPGTMASAV